MLRTLATVALAVLVAGCGDRGHPYPPDVVENFLHACTARGAPEGACRCSLDAVRRRFTVDEYRALEARVARGEVPRELSDLAADCR
jgi:hypothetical protein